MYHRSVPAADYYVLREVLHCDFDRILQEHGASSTVYILMVEFMSLEDGQASRGVGIMCGVVACYFDVGCGH